MKTIEAKLGNMRKPQRFIVQLTDTGEFLVQSDKSIGKFDMNTGKGVLNTKGCYFVHLSFGAVPYQFPTDFVKECHQAFALKGDLIGASAETGPVYYGGISVIKPLFDGLIKPADSARDYWPERDTNSYPMDFQPYKRPDYANVLLDLLARERAVLKQIETLTAERNHLHNQITIVEYKLYRQEH